MESELWSTMNELPLGDNIVVVDRCGNYLFIEEATKSDFANLIDDGYTKWCYLADLVQAAYEM